MHVHRPLRCLLGTVEHRVICGARDPKARSPCTEAGCPKSHCQTTCTPPHPSKPLRLNGSTPHDLQARVLQTHALQPQTGGVHPTERRWMLPSATPFFPWTTNVALHPRIQPKAEVLPAVDAAQGEAIRVVEHPQGRGQDPGPGPGQDPGPGPGQGHHQVVDGAADGAVLGRVI